ncbi:MAG: DsbC family protein, partial [Gammaproteobacteria bacterium]
MIKLRHLFITNAVMCTLAMSSVWAADTPSNAGPDAETLKKQWGELLQDAEISKIKPASIPGLWEVDAGSHIFYATEKGDKLVFGDILALDPKAGYVNQTEESRQAIRLQILKDLDKNDMITFAAKDSKHNIYVFTDPDCGYCRKFHEERDAILNGGITINYLAMPRTPKGTPSYNKSVAIWCAKDRQQALTEAKEDKFK